MKPIKKTSPALWSLLAAVLLLLGCTGCSQPHPRAWVDVGEVSSRVSARPDTRTVLEENTQEEAPRGPRVKELTPQGDGGNVFLADLAMHPSSPPASPATEDAEGEGLLLNFDNADLFEFIQVVAEALGIDYIVDPNVQGAVNIRSHRKVPLDRLFAVFKKILNINGLDIRDEGSHYYIYPAKAPSVDQVSTPEGAQSLSPSPRMVMQVVPVMHLSSKDAAGFIQPYLSAQGLIHNLAPQNTLILQDSESKVLDALNVLARLDVSPLASLKLRLVRVDKAPLFKLRDEMVEILSTLKVNQKEFEGLSVLPMERINSLLLVSKSEFLLDTADRWIKELDVAPAEGRDNIYIYNVRNSVASELAALVNSLISGKPESKQETAKGKEGAGQKPATTAAPQPALTARDGNGLRFAGEPLLLADDARNIILIRALNPDYVRLVKLLERLDNLPRQVLIEVLVAEVSLTDSWELGIEWALKNNQLKIDSTRYSQTLSTDFSSVTTAASGGLTYSIFRSSSDVVGLLNAIASVTDVSLLSSPHLLVLNNEEATVNVGDQVPIITTETQREGESTTVDKTVQYRDTGTILTVRPRINYDGVIILEVNQQVSSAKTNTLGGTESPVISTREVKTKLAVKNGQTILMGGLIRRENEVNQSKVPLLGDIPLLGWLFKYQKDQVDKTELLVMITPYVIESEDVLDQYIRQFKEKMQELKRSLKEESQG